MSLYPVSPCRVADTRAGEGKSGAFGPPALQAGVARSFALPDSGCGIPATAKAYAMNVTVVPASALGYLSIWPAGSAQPVVSTLNSWDGRIVANAAIVPAGTAGGVSVFVDTGTPNLVLDIFGYFAP